MAVLDEFKNIKSPDLKKVKDLGDFGAEKPVQDKVHEILDEEKYAAFDLDEISRRIRLIENTLGGIKVLLENIQTQTENIFQQTIKTEEVQEE